MHDIAAHSDKTSFLTHLKDDPRRIGSAIVLGFSTGLPFLLVYSTQSAWLYEANVPIETIGLLSEMTLAYKFKWVWAPFLDEYDAPIFSKLLGRRRGWIVVSQIATVIALIGVAFGDPANWLAWTVLFSFALGVAGATQDITVDGWRITVVPRERLAFLTSVAEMGYRVGTLAAGAGALYVAHFYGWRAAYLCMAGIMLFGLAAALVAPEPPSDLEPHRERPDFLFTVTEPIKELWRRLGPMALAILILIAGFRMPGYVSGAMAMPLFKSLHFSEADIATVTKVFGFWISLGGTLLAGLVVRQFGMMKSLLIGTVAGSASHLSLAWLAAHGHDFTDFALAVGVDGFAYAFAQVVLIIYMSSLVSTEFATSQYALLTSLCALPGSVLAGASGFIIRETGFPAFFIGTSLMGIPVAILAWWVWREEERRGEDTLAETSPERAAETD
ncbi:AmpG family muropeptide MFS transporter [Methylocystis parvus]|uniref:AmpG family muropeptide MFS transporter n=1 Tax=Methylocystis parvus TaxID=134 RepID=A0A6B8M1E1_9HYPH|nr:MFS transporter [Methylocystis parvus]QGM96105.1 AmpG family muropeptide MFS transporter [Methylocystis parvus]WBK00072.1 MFS transporter [Methylocystis parvus OBBP]